VYSYFLVVLIMTLIDHAGAYLFHISAVLLLFTSLEGYFVRSSHIEFDCASSYSETLALLCLPILTSIDYVKSLLVDIRYLLTYKNDFTELSQRALMAYTQPVKIAAAITLASLLIVIDSARRATTNGFWATTVVFRFLHFH